MPSTKCCRKKRARQASACFESTVKLDPSSGAKAPPSSSGTYGTSKLVPFQSRSGLVIPLIVILLAIGAAAQETTLRTQSNGVLVPTLVIDTQGQVL